MKKEFQKNPKAIGHLTQINLYKGIPFEIRVPNELTVKTIQKAGNGKGLHKVNSVDELFRELDS
ncbi:MAG: type II toxin-antitoxin system RelB/DinJ family antitoxin [Candidatus Anammoxibacter sp.]